MKKSILLTLILLSMFSLMAFSGVKTVLAENIDPDNNGSQYAYGENVGWLNLEPEGDGGCGVEVGDDELTGYMWGENIGWISLSCTDTDSCEFISYGITNDGNGNLSGYAWGENVGWISFSCENTESCITVDFGVEIDPDSGLFCGFAWAENIGWINFAPEFGGRAKTSWRVCPDADDDGYDDMVCGGDDCDDTDPHVNPGAEEICDNGIDDDCDGLVDGEDPDCIVEFTLVLDASFTGGYLVLSYTIGTPEPATWSNYLILTYPSVQVIPLWSVPLTVIQPPYDIPVSFPFPSLGWVGIYTGLFTAEGAQAVELVWVNTG